MEFLSTRFPPTLNAPNTPCFCPHCHAEFLTFLCIVFTVECAVSPLSAQRFLSLWAPSRAAKLTGGSALVFAITQCHTALLPSAVVLLRRGDNQHRCFWYHVPVVGSCAINKLQASSVNDAQCSACTQVFCCVIKRLLFGQMLTAAQSKVHCNLFRQIDPSCLHWEST